MPGFSSVTMGALLMIASLVSAQTRTFTRDDLEFAFEFPSPAWRAVSRLDVHEHVDFVHGEGVAASYLHVRKKLVTVGTGAAELFSQDEKWELQKLPGYVVCCEGKGEDFAGTLQAKVFSYEFTSAGRPTSGRLYYLKVDNRTFYVLHFRVGTDKLSDLRDDMNLIARSFHLKK